MALSLLYPCFILALSLLYPCWNLSASPCSTHRAEKSVTWIVWRAPTASLIPHPPAPFPKRATLYTHRCPEYSSSLLLIWFACEYNVLGGCFTSFAMTRTAWGTGVASLRSQWRSSFHSSQFKLQSEVQILTVFIGFFNQINFICSRTFFYLLFTDYDFIINEFFIKNQCINNLNRCETIRI